MGKKRTIDGVRIDLYIDRKDLEGLELRKQKTGLNVSEQVRFAVKEFLNKDPSEDIPRQIHKPSQEVFDIVKYLTNLIPEGGKHKVVELKKDPMMLMFSKEWFRLKQMIEMTVEVLRAKKYPDIIFEEVIYPIEVPGTQRTRQHRYGFSIDFGKNTTNKELRGLLDDLDKEIKARGKLGLVPD